MFLLAVVRDWRAPPVVLPRWWLHLVAQSPDLLTLGPQLAVCPNGTVQSRDPHMQGSKSLVLPNCQAWFLAPPNHEIRPEMLGS